MKVKKIGEKLSRGKMYSWDSESVKIFEESWGFCELTPSTSPSRTAGFLQVTVYIIYMSGFFEFRLDSGSQGFQPLLINQKHERLFSILFCYSS